MATRQVPEGRQHQFFARAVIRAGIVSPAVGEAGQAQPVVAPAHHRHRVQVTAEIEMAWPGFGAMAEPEGAEAVSYTHLTLPTIYSV